MVHVSVNVGKVHSVVYMYGWFVSLTNTKVNLLRFWIGQRFVSCSIQPFIIECSLGICGVCQFNLPEKEQLLRIQS